MTDTWQASSVYKASTKTGYDPLSGGNGYQDGIVGVVMFKWISNHGSTLTNVTTQQLKSLYSSGFMDSVLINGTGTPNTNYVYPVGRDKMSGTRLTAFAESGVGATAAVTQWEPQTSLGAQIAAAGTNIDQLGIPTDPTDASGYSSNGGYSSGGNLCKALACSGMTDSNITLVGYAGSSDTDSTSCLSHATYPAVELGFNGVKLGGDGNAKAVDTAASYMKVALGQYTFWGYEHLYYNGLTGVKKTVADKVAKQIREGNAGAVPYAADAPHPLLSEMKVKRTVDGALVNLDSSVPSYSITNAPY